MRDEKLELKKIINDITGLNEDAIEEARLRVNSLAKPLGSLGKLEDIAIKLAGITGKIKNSINKKCIFFVSILFFYTLFLHKSFFIFINH